MKRLLVVMLVPLLAFFSVNSFADTVGVIDMQKIFQTSPQVKQINDNLKKQFAGRKGDLDKMGKTLQADMAQYKKNKSVMNSKDLAQLEQKINGERQKLQQADAQFQHDLFTAQNEKTTKFLDEVKGVVKTVAAKNNLDMVLPKRALLYSKDGLDITPKVLTALDKG